MAWYLDPHLRSASLRRMTSPSSVSCTEPDSSDSLNSLRRPRTTTYQCLLTRWLLPSISDRAPLIIKRTSRRCSTMSRPFKMRTPSLEHTTTRRGKKPQSNKKMREQQYYFSRIRKSVKDLKILD